MQQKLLLILLVVFIGNTGFSQSKIEKAEESLKQNDDSNSEVKFEGNDNASTNSDTSLLEETIGRLFVEIFAYTAYGILIESPFEKDSPSSSATLTKHPYFNSNNGNYSYEWDDHSAVGRTTISSRYIFENSRLDGNHLNINFRFYNKLALEMDYLQLWEHNPNFGYHTLALYTALAKYHRVRTKRFDGWWGIGASYVDGNVDDFGFTLGLGAEIFLGKPISIETNFNHTFINNNSINKFNALINYHIKQYKLNGGYESLKIGSQYFSTISFGLGMSF
ncbi:hypothetical protein [Seonamhaeicola sp.]|uniref:hypothetical protein n=1 Tax=Seonamhaeicola sp. TaxID=1912245 RepID=UPI00263169F0|nr:hypothetical protein [Seonamhaeicola sp.]